MWLAISVTLTGDVSHNSRCGNVNGWRRVFPLASHCLRRSRLSPDMNQTLLSVPESFAPGGPSAAALSPSKPSISSSERASKFTSSADVASGIVMRAALGAEAPPALFAPMCSAINATIWPIVRARIRLAGGSATPREPSIRVFDLNAHERIQSQVRQRLVIAQASLVLRAVPSLRHRARPAR